VTPIPTAINNKATIGTKNQKNEFLAGSPLQKAPVWALRVTESGILGREASNAAAPATPITQKACLGPESPAGCEQPSSARWCNTMDRPTSEDIVMPVHGKNVVNKLKILLLQLLIDHISYEPSIFSVS
jgi:hypothetical protein